MNAQAKPYQRASFIDPVREAEAAKALRESIAAMDEGDDEVLILDVIEGETGFFEAIDALLVRIAADRGMVTGLASAYSDLEVRQARFEKRIEANRALIEQAMCIAEVRKLERPAATLSLTQRGPKLEVTTEAEIPSQFWLQGAPKLDRKGLLDALQEGQSVTGACLTNAAPVLAVRTK